MASVVKEILIDVSADDTWKVIGDFGAGPYRMAPGYVLKSEVDGDDRIVTFANGDVRRERFISRNDEIRRVVYYWVEPAHNNASMQVFPDGRDNCRLLWIHDVLPDDLASPLDTAMTEAASIIKRTLESKATP